MCASLPSSAGAGGVPEFESDRSGHRELRDAVLHPAAEVERGVTLQCGAGHCGERPQLRDGEVHFRLQGTGGLRRALRGKQRMLQRELDRAVGRLEMCGGIERQRRRREQVRRRARDAQPIRRGMQMHQPLVAGDIRCQALHPAAGGVDLIEPQLAVHVRSLEGSLHPGIERDGLPGHVRPRGHRRRMGGDRQVRGVMHEVQGALRARRKWAGVSREMRCDRVAGAIQFGVDRDRAQVRQLRHRGDQSMWRLVGLKAQVHLGRIDFGVQLVASRRVEARDGELPLTR